VVIQCWWNEFYYLALATSPSSPGSLTLTVALPESTHAYALVLRGAFPVPSTLLRALLHDRWCHRPAGERDFFGDSSELGGSADGGAEVGRG
jgi:hypothetical protein